MDAKGEGGLSLMACRFVISMHKRISGFADFFFFFKLFSSFVLDCLLGFALCAYSFPI